LAQDFHLIKHVLLIIACLLLTACQSLSILNSDSRETVNKTPANLQPIDKKEKVIALDICLAIESPFDPESFANAWDRVTSQLSMDIPENKRIQAQKNWYLKHPSYLTRVSKRSQPYLYFIIEELEKRELPLELALLPIVESAFDPFAYSHGRASGMWQFIPGTGKGYGLSQNWWYDGRRDVYLSTHAALDYLTYLNKRFNGNWLHALAAYNSGQGNVGRAIRKNKAKGKATDFWSLKLPKETKAYVPKLLALAEILRNRKSNKTVWTWVDNQPFFSRVATEGQIDLTLAADLSEISMNQFYQLNPAYNHWATPPNGPHYILLPVDKTETFSRNLATVPKSERIAHQRYTIKSGDSLSEIATKFSTTVELLRANNQIRSNRITAGKSLLIPIASKQREKYSKSNQQRLLSKQNRKRKGNKVTVEVRSGDSFWTLSRQYKVNLRSLAGWNNMAPTDTLRVGQKLVVWTEQPGPNKGLASMAKKTKKIHYKVRNGDSFARIADKFNVSLNKIKKWNRNLSKRKYLQPGQSLTLFVDITKQF
jgi:membrane-bound lytic murein transglycosylase D